MNHKMNYLKRVDYSTQTPSKIWKRRKSMKKFIFKNCLEFVRRVKVTNLQNVGWISADRGTKATLMRTIPSSLFKSSTKDLSLPIFELGFSFVCQQAFTRRQCRSNFMILGILRNKFLKNLYVLMITSWEGCISPLSSMDSGLEAFSRNPTHGSFAALTFQSTAFAKYVNQRFLSY